MSKYPAFLHPSAHFGRDHYPMGEWEDESERESHAIAESRTSNAMGRAMVLTSRFGHLRLIPGVSLVYLSFVRDKSTNQEALIFISPSPSMPLAPRVGLKKLRPTFKNTIFCIVIVLFECACTPRAREMFVKRRLNWKVYFRAGAANAHHASLVVNKEWIVRRHATFFTFRSPTWMDWALPPKQRLLLAHGNSLWPTLLCCQVRSFAALSKFYRPPPRSTIIFRKGGKGCKLSGKHLFHFFTLRSSKKD